MTARSRPRARIAALKVAARFAPEAVRITSDRPDTDPDGAWMGAPPVQRDERRDPDHDRHDAQPGRVYLPSVREGGGADRERNQVDRHVDDAVAAATLLVGGVDYDVRQRG